MNEAERSTGTESMLEAADVVAYLQRHPDFLRRHPEVVEALDLRHDSGSAASLIERQVAMLRDENRRLQSRLQEFMAAARGNEQRVGQLNSVARALVSAGDIKELVNGLSDCLQREMSVDMLFMGIRSTQGLAGEVGEAVHVLTDDDPCDEAVTHVFRRGKPVCGPLSDTQAAALFAGRQPAPASAAMVPLGVNGVHGALVLASTESKRFVPDMGALFLELLGELVTTALRRHLGPENLP